VSVISNDYIMYFDISISITVLDVTSRPGDRIVYCPRSAGKTLGCCIHCNRVWD